MTEPVIVFGRKNLAARWLAEGSEALHPGPLTPLVEDKLDLPQRPYQRWNSQFLMLEQAGRERYYLAKYMEALCFGSDPRQWGILSGGHADAPYGGRIITLESTLRGLKETVALPQKTAGRINRTLSMLPTMRAQAELGLGQTQLGIMESSILGLANETGLDHVNRRKIIVHLPSRLRPVPESLSALECSLPPVTLHVEFQDSGHYWPGTQDQARLKLQDIIVDSGLRGRGLGTATLTEICLYADTRGLPLWGIFDPTASEEALERLARWYFRMGFVQAGREPRSWRRRETILREPVRAASKNSGGIRNSI